MSKRNLKINSDIQGTNNPILTLEEVAELTRYSVGYLRRVYPFWMDKGIHVLKAAPNAKPRFFRKEIIELMMRQK